MFDTKLHEEIAVLVSNDLEFRRLYHRHEKLDRQVMDAQLGVLPLDAQTLRKIKFEKLAAKEQLERLYDQRRPVAHC